MTFVSSVMNKVNSISRNNNAFSSTARRIENCFNGAKAQKPRVEIDIFSMYPGNAGSELCNAAGVMERYAKANDSYIKFYEVSKRPKTLEGIEDGLNSPNNIGLTIETKGKEPKHCIIEYEEKGTKPFLRKLYELLQLEIEGTEPRIVKEKSNTINRLIKEGKLVG